MGDIKISRPVLIALIGAILVGGFLLFKQSTGEQVAIAPPAPATPAVTASTSKTGATSVTSKTTAERRADARKKLEDKAAAEGMPVGVYKAKRDGKEVIIFFWEPNGEDDRAVDAAVKEVKGSRKNLVVFRDTVSNKSQYDGIAQAAAATQTPSVIILYGDKGTLVQGYVDSATLNEKISQLVNSAN